MEVIGEKICLDRVVELAEEVAGRKFEVRKLRRQDLEKQLESLNNDADMLERMCVQLKLVVAHEEVEGGV